MRPATPEEVAAYQAAAPKKLRPATSEEHAEFAASQQPERGGHDPISRGQTAVENFAQGGTFGWSDELGARLQQGLAALKNDPNLDPAEVYRQALGENRDILHRSMEERPVLSIASNVAGGLAPSLVPGAALGRTGQALTGVGRVAQAAGQGAIAGAGGSTEGQRMGGAGVGAVIGGALGGVGEGIGRGASAIARRFPWIADRLAERVTGQTAKDVANRVLKTADESFPAGDYANSVLDLGLNRATAGGTVEAATAARQAAGGQLGALRQGLSVPGERVEGLVHPVIQNAPLEARDAALGLQRNLFGPAHTDQAFNSAMSPAGGKIDLNTLAQLTQEHVGDPLQQLSRKAAMPNAPYINPQVVKALGGLKGGLEDLQRGAIGEAGGSPSAYDAARKAYAISSQAGKGAASEIGKEVARVGAGGATGYVLAGKEGAIAGAGLSSKSGRRLGAYAALNAYNATRSPATQAVMKAAQGALGPAAAAIAAKVASSGNPTEAGVALQQGQANDPAVRQGLKESE